MKRPLALIAASFAVILAVWLLVFHDRGNSAREGGKERTAVVQRGDLTLKVIETGSIEPATVVEIKSEQSGEVKQLFIKEGETVRRGQRLAVILQEAAQAQLAAQYRADLEREQLSLDEARRQLERHRALHEKGFLSRQEVETSEKNVEVARIRMALARRQLSLVLGGDERTLEGYLSRPLSADHLEEFVVIAPVDGTVIALEVEQGEIINSGTSTVTGGTVLMTVADLGRMVVRTKINEVNIARVARRQPVEIRLDAVPGRVYHGAVGLIAPQGVRTDNIVTYEVTVTITDADARLKPSMTANIDILTGTLERALFVPVEAIDRQAGRDIVLLRRGAELVTRPVTISLRTEREAVLLEGPAGGDPPLVEGDLVVIPAPGATPPS